jgi:hypothetical protein
LIDLPRPIPDSYWVIPGKLLAGEHPIYWSDKLSHQQLSAFLQAGFDTFIDLTEPDEVQPYLPILIEESRLYLVNIRYKRFSIGDFGLPRSEQMKTILDSIDQAITQGRQVYLHCLAGAGRTGTVVGCFLVRHGLTGEQALRQLAEWWQTIPRNRIGLHSPETSQQEKFVRLWQE